MTRFEDGPLAGKTLMLKRAPLYLRATMSAGGKMDALNMLEDEPRADETLYAYRRHGQGGICHVSMSDRRQSGFYVTATYLFVSEQPSDDVMRSTVQWREWCRTQKATL